MKKFVIGWVTFKPEMRDRFVAVARQHVAAMRSEEGWVFAEINLRQSTGRWFNVVSESKN